MTLQSGQVFHWNQRADGSWSGLISNHAVTVSEKNRQLVLFEGDPRLVARYFALDHPLEEIYPAFPDEPLSQSALAACRGMRILRQPRWECVATFITSSMKQVSHIRGMSLAIRSCFGQAVQGSEINAYPAFEVLAKATEPSLRDCGLGYRAENLLKTAQRLADGTIDAACSDHTPVDEDAKQLPFGESEAGATGLELLLPLTLKWAAEQSIDRPTALARITTDPARILGLPAGRIEAGARADLCLFDPLEDWIVGPSTLVSQGKNTPFSGLPMSGRVRHTVVGGELVFSRARSNVTTLPRRP
jgi:hypothetical protein